MTLIAGLLPAANVKLGVAASSKKSLFEQVSVLFGGSLPINPAQILVSLVERERMGSTGLGQGIAIPHGRVKGLKDAVGAFVRTQAPMEFESPDGKPVTLIFVLLVPEKANDVHLQILSELAQMFSDREMRRRLSEAVDEKEAQQLIVGWDPNAPNQRRPAL